VEYLYLIAYPEYEFGHIGTLLDPAPGSIHRARQLRGLKFSGKHHSDLLLVLAATLNKTLFFLAFRLPGLSSSRGGCFDSASVFCHGDFVW
jgi:hypothetical protein